MRDASCGRYSPEEPGSFRGGGIEHTQTAVSDVRHTCRCTVSPCPLIPVEVPGPVHSRDGSGVRRRGTPTTTVDRRSTELSWPRRGEYARSARWDGEGTPTHIHTALRRPPVFCLMRRTNLRPQGGGRDEEVLQRERGGGRQGQVRRFHGTKFTLLRHIQLGKTVKRHHHTSPCRPSADVAHAAVCRQSQRYWHRCEALAGWWLLVSSPGDGIVRWGLTVTLWDCRASRRWRSGR